MLLVLPVEPLPGGPVSGHVARLVAANSGVVQEVVAEGVGRAVHWVSGSGPGRKRIRPNSKTSCTPRRFGGSISSTGVEEIVSRGAFFWFHS